MANQISPDTYAMMLATFAAGDTSGCYSNGDIGPNSAEENVMKVNELLKAANLEIGDYRNYLPALG